MAKILVLTSRWPFPPHGGDKHRILEICRQLAKEHELTLVAVTDSRTVASPGADATLFRTIERIFIPRWRSYLNCLLALPGRSPLQLKYYWSRAFQVAVLRHLPGKDVVLAHLIRTAQYVPLDFPGFKLLEMTDAISLGLERGREPGAIGKSLSRIYAVEAGRVLSYEKHCLDTFDVVTLVSDIDRQYLEKIHGASKARLVVASIGVSESRFRAAVLSGGNIVVFLGNMQTLPNIDACAFFIRECLPIIRRSLPDVVFRIVGPIPKKVKEELLAMGGPVELVGAVGDLAVAMTGAFCAVAPMRRGAGIQTKVLDYMALGIPTILTDIAYEGLSAIDQRDLVIANSAAEIADAVVRMKADPDRAGALGVAGRAYVASKHVWSDCVAPIRRSISEWMHRCASADIDSGAGRAS